MGLQPFPECLEGDVGKALMGLFTQVSGALSCWAACEGASLLSEAA